MIAALRDVVIAAPISFLVGLLVGWFISSKYRITKINGNNHTP